MLPGTIFSDDYKRLIKVDERENGTFEIPSGVEVIEMQAFRDCTRISEIIIPVSLKRIQTNAFGGCTLIENVTYKGPLVQWFNILFASRRSHPCSYGASLKTADFGNDPIRHLNVPSSAVQIPSFAFCGCRIETVKIPANIKRIGIEAFSHCNWLAKVEIDEGLHTIDMNAFSCSGLRSINLPNSLKQLSLAAFERTSLRHLYLPRSLEVVGAHLLIEGHPEAEFFCEGIPGEKWTEGWNKIKWKARTARAKTHLNVPRWWYELNVVSKT